MTRGVTEQVNSRTFTLKLGILIVPYERDAITTEANKELDGVAALARNYLYEMVA